MSKKILIMGLPGSGKTTLAEKLVPLLKAEWLNADRVREEYKDWDFSNEGRLRQAKRLADKAQIFKLNNKNVVVDFVCPTPETRKEFDADYTVWIDTIKKSKFEDTNKVFIPPEHYDFRVSTQDAEKWALQIADNIKPYCWDDKKPTAQMLGRWQPFHEGHFALFEEIVKKTGQVYIMVRDMPETESNPFNFDYVKDKIDIRLKEQYKDRYRIVQVPNITNICYGRKVGYTIEEMVLPEHIQKISATDIRKTL